MFEFSCKIKRFVQLFFHSRYSLTHQTKSSYDILAHFLSFLFNFISVLEYIQFKILKGSRKVLER
jgi:hypothetical protein